MSAQVARIVAAGAIITLLVTAPASAFRYVDVGARAPSMQLADAAGRVVHVPASGRPTLVLFWRPGQQLSEDALADLAALQDSARGVEVIAVAEGPVARRTVPGGVQMVADVDGRAAERYGVIVHPSTALVGADGRLLYALPSHPPVYRALVAAQLAQLRGERPDPFSTRVAESGPQASATEAAVLYRRGLALTAEGRLDEAATVLARAIAADGAHADARLALGNVRLQQGRAADALGEFEALIARNPALPGARVGRGIARLRLGQTEEGIRLLEEAIELNPEPVRAHYELARAYEATGAVERALQHYREAYAKLRQGRK